MSRSVTLQPNELDTFHDRLVRVERVPLAALMYGAAIGLCIPEERLHVFRRFAASSGDAKSRFASRRIPRRWEERLRP